MEDWQNILDKKDLTEKEIKSIPGASCENFIAMKNYFVNQKHYSENELLENLEITKEKFNDPKNWINPLDAKQFFINTFKRGKEFLTHHDYFDAGRYFKFSENSLFMIYFKMIPPE